jgi:hypothetical protein
MIVNLRTDSFCKMTMAGSVDRVLGLIQAVHVDRAASAALTRP